MGNVTLSSKFQISVPKDVRERMGWKPGQKLAFVYRGGGGYELVPVPKLEDLIGIAEGADPTGYRDRNDRY
jgi:AbrB family looped-hinge helix DNA binding protein